MERTNRTRLSCEALDERIVPAAFRYLTTPGAEVVASGAILRQSAAVPDADLNSIVRLLGDDGTVRGYNTDARPLQFDEVRDRNLTRSLTLGQVPTVVVAGVTYREFVLDVNERQNSPTVSLDAVQIFLGNSPTLNGYNARNDTLAGRTAAFDLDSARDVSVILNANLNRGQGAGDMVLLVPESKFAGATDDTYLYLYSEFGGRRAREDGGFEQWSVRDVVAQPPTNTASISGSVRANDNGNLGTVTVHLLLQDADGNYNEVATTTIDANGNYQFGNLAAGVYGITVSSSNYPAGLYFPGFIDGSGDGELGEEVDGIFGINLDAGQVGTGYEFIGEEEEMG